MQDKTLFYTGLMEWQETEQPSTNATTKGADTTSADAKGADTKGSGITSVNAKRDIASWAVRLAFLVVFILNCQCALSFIIDPTGFMGAYELSGLPGQIAIQGLGIAFLMWNATYPLFIYRPKQHQALGVIILVQQIIGLVGESLLRVGLPAGHAQLAASMDRFILFDGLGLVVMAATAAFLFAQCRREGWHKNQRTSGHKSQRKS